MHLVDNMDVEYGTAMLHAAHPCLRTVSALVLEAYASMGSNSHLIQAKRFSFCS